MVGEWGCSLLNYGRGLEPIPCGYKDHVVLHCIFIFIILAYMSLAIVFLESVVLAFKNHSRRFSPYKGLDQELQHSKATQEDTRNKCREYLLAVYIYTVLTGT